MSADKYGFVYIWYDRKYKRYYIGCHWGHKDDGYVCSSSWMKKSYKVRQEDFKRRILKSHIQTRHDMFIEEQKWLDMIKENEIKPINDKPKYYNLNIKNNSIWHKYDEHIKTVGQKISAAKKGKKTGPRDPSIGAAISMAKKESFARRKSELGYKFTPEHVANNKSAQYKKYLITLTNSSTVEVNGLKRYAEENNIPYASLARASQKGSSLAKYGIREICPV